MGSLFGGGSSTTVVQAQQPTAAQEALTSSQVELAQEQLRAIREQTTFQQSLAAGSQEAADLQLQLLRSAVTELDRPQTEGELSAAQLQQRVLERSLEQLERGPGATPEELDAIQRATGSALARGESDIARFTSESLGLLREELAPSLGLRPTDTPILDRGARVAEESVRQQGQLASQLAGVGAQAELNFPLARQQLEASITQGTGQLNLAAQQFQNQLRDSAILNRLRLSGSAGSRVFNAGQLGLGLATGVQANPANVFDPGGSTTTSNQPANILGGIASIAGGIGGLATGLGAIGGSSLLSGLSLFSDEDAKNIIAVIDDDQTFEAIRQLPISIWSYKHDNDNEPHAGPMAQDLQRLFGIGDGRSFNVIDAVGSLYVISRVLAKKIEDFENGGRRSRTSGPGLGLAA